MASQKVSQTPLDKPRFFYGYVIVIAGLVILTTTIGLNYTFGIFFNSLIDEFGWSRAITSAAYSISAVIAGSLGIIAGRLSERFGTRVVSAVSGSFLGVGFILMSQINAVWQFYLVYGLVVAAGTGPCWPIMMSLVPRWFVSRRGLMTGILATGVGFGIVALPPLANWLIYNLDWRTAYIIVGSGALILIAVAAQFIRDPSKQIGQQPYGMDKTKPESLASKDAGLDLKEAIRTRQFALMGIMYFCFGFCLHSVMVHIVPHAADLKIPVTSATSILSIIGVVSIIGKLLIGSTSDRFGVKPSLIFSFVLLFLAFVWLQFTRELWMFYLFATLFALAYGGVMTMQTLMSAELFGLRSLAAMLGVISFIYTIGSAVGPFVTGYIFDITKSYNPAFLIATVLAVAGAVLASLLKRPGGNSR